MKKKIAFNFTLSALSILFIILAVFPFRSSYIRFYEGLRDLVNSFQIYLSEIFEFEIQVAPTVGDYSSVIDAKILPENISAFKAKFLTWFYLLFNGGNITIFGNDLGAFFTTLAMIISIAVPVIIVLYFALKKIYGISNNKHNKDTVPLKVFKKISNTIYEPAKHFLLDFIEYFSNIKWLKKSWIVLWVFNFNFATIIIEFIAFYLYFSVTFNFLDIYKQICKLFIDLQVVIKAIPLWGWIIIGLLVFDSIRKRIAIKRLRHREARNCGFINELPIVSIACGSMGKKKTTLITDMALSQEVMFRQKILDLLQKNDMKFPYFPWIELELEIKACLDYGIIYNLATVKQFIKKKKARFDKHKNPHLQLYGYDIEKYGFYYNNGLYESDLFSVLETYSQLYFMYIIESSLIVSNYSIRTDNSMIDNGNFPLWIMGFFPKHFRSNYRHSNILDFDILRLGKKVLENNPNVGSFEFGVVVISEIGKERGNNLELQEVKKKNEETNQKNDLFNAWLKMCRHSATVDNFPFIKVFTDEQRPESWGADARDLCDIIHIVRSSEQYLTLPFYTIEEMISECMFNWFIGIYNDFRYNRGDNTLLIHILKKFTAFVFRRNIRIYNKYGYSILKFEKERGTMDSKTEMRKYYIMNSKIYRKRFSTDCFSDYFNDLAKKAKIGLNDYREYLTEKASIEELKMQNSYFINALYKDTSD